MQWQKQSPALACAGIAEHCDPQLIRRVRNPPMVGVLEVAFPVRDESIAAAQGSGLPVGSSHLPGMLYIAHTESWQLLMCFNYQHWLHGQGKLPRSCTCDHQPKATFGLIHPSDTALHDTELMCMAVQCWSPLLFLFGCRSARCVRTAPRSCACTRCR